MHQSNYDLSLEEISKIEGQASLDLKVRNGKLSELKFRIADYKRFYTQAVEGKSILGVPQQVARICGTCSNAHLLCSIKTIENAIQLKVSPQTQKLRELLQLGLMIRDHALHLYIFVLPDLFGKDSILEFDEKDQRQHELLHAAFAVKEAGNLLSIWAGGRSVHAPYAAVGGFTLLPKTSPRSIIDKLRAIRPQILQLIELFRNDSTTIVEDVVFAALDDRHFSFLKGDIITSQQQYISAEHFHNHLNHVAVAYSQASAYRLDNKILMVGALARVNLLKENLHQDTIRDAQAALELFPSKNIFHNNLAQAIEILHSIDHALDLLSSFTVQPEKPVPIVPRESIGQAAIEAPRGILFHEYAIDAQGKVTRAKIVVPTGLNQLLIEHSLKDYLSDKVALGKERVALEAEKLVRAYDPCISCAAHFLKIKWR